MKSFIRYFTYLSSISFLAYAGFQLLSFLLNTKINGAEAISRTLGSGLPLVLALLAISYFALLVSFDEMANERRRRGSMRNFLISGVLTLGAFFLAWAGSPLFATKTIDLSVLVQLTGLLSVLAFGAAHIIRTLDSVGKFLSYEVVDAISSIQYKLADMKRTASAS